MTFKIVEMDIFDPGQNFKWVRCPHCERAVNVYDKAKPDPFTFGSATPEPETMTHSCIIRCRCKKTTVKVYGVMKRVRGIGCTCDSAPATQKPTEES